ncbi:hypothetical protein FAM09_10935 [Niastella caeni]|uniref:Right-handed parallel beta-helix repeat-containing protein n=1 Tax=Niastella caeni TaxID=2569763 RepID=A0A4S8I1J6_9BACT|nr:hypothetical protein [Niastella caeni]THU40374.1 hypothetical protein FAM09_10935 [Niastella caeni]
MKRKEFLKKGVTGMVALSSMTALLNACSKKTNDPVNDDDKGDGPGPIPAMASLSATHWVSATATGSGNGTQQNPYTLTQALQLAQPGWRVCCGPGEYIGVNRNHTWDTSFQIRANGTEDNPIIFFAQNYAALNTSGRSILRHNGTQQGYGCPVLGLVTGHHWYGFYITESLAPTKADTGPIVCSGKYNRISYFRIDRGPVTWPEALSDNNHAAIRFEGVGVQNNLVSDCWIENYSRENAFRSEQGIQLFSQNDSTITTSTGRLIIENCFFDNVETALTSKGAGTSRWILGGIVFRRNLVRASTATNTVGAVNFMDTSGELGRNQVYQNIQVGGNYFVVCWSMAGYPIRDIDVINNTLINATMNREIEGIHTAYAGAGTTGSGWRIHNNIKTGTAPLFNFPKTQSDAAVLSRSHNLSFGHSRWGYVHSRGTATQSLAEWVANTQFDDFSLESDPQLVSSVWGNANLGKLQQTSPARNAAIDLLNLNGNGTSAACHMGAYSNDNVVIGIRPLA